MTDATKIAIGDNLQELRGVGLRERYALGKSLRRCVPRETLADFTLSVDRDPAANIAETMRTRLPSLRPMRRKLMIESPFAFLRGAADVMAFDLARQPAPGLMAQACGDCHLMNFGAFESPEGNVLFDVNDFDETLPNVDITFDLRRLATSIVVAARDSKYSEPEARRLAHRAVRSYRKTMHGLAVMSPMKVWNVRVRLRDVMDTLRDRVLHDKVKEAISTESRQKAPTDSFPKIEKPVDGEWRIIDRPPKLVHLDAIPDPGARIDVAQLFAHTATEALQEPVATLLGRYQLRDVAFKAVGVGSVGTFCAIGLFMTEDEEPLFLQLKEAQPSTLERFGLGTWNGKQGKRVTFGQRVMQAASDIFLGAAEDPGSGRHFYMRHLKTRRLGSLSEVFKDEALPRYSELCGCTLARAHARSSNAAVLAGYMGNSGAFDDALASFATQYARQTKKDHAAFCASHVD